MKKINSNRIYTLLLFMIIVSSFCSVFFTDYRTHMIDFTVRTLAPNSNYNNSLGFSELNLDKANIKLRYEGKNLGLTLPIYMDTNRYYLPLIETINGLKGTLNRKNNTLNVSFNNVKTVIAIDENSFTTNNTKRKLKHPLLKAGEIPYISLYDFCTIFNLKTLWSTEQNTISLYINKDSVTAKPSINNGRPALLRLEDITAGDIYKSTEALQKLRTIADYLYSENIPFYVAWIPRYVNPSDKIDNDLTSNFNIYNADFLFTLDYMLGKNGYIGLHGYTHQFGNSITAAGTEFHARTKDNIPNDPQYILNRITASKAAAKKLNIPFSFFEAPHYAILPAAMNIAEENFDYIYEPYSTNGGITEAKHVTEKRIGNRTVKYIPTPLDYVRDSSDTENMIRKIENLNTDYIGSFFYHPSIEFQYIEEIKNSSGIPQYNYSKASPLHKIINSFKNNGYVFKTITSI